MAARPNVPEERNRVCLARIVGVHGVRGLLVVRPFTEVPEDVVAYGPVTTGGGRALALQVKGAKKAGLLVAAEGVTTREAAEALKGEDLFVGRDALPVPHDEEWYHADLVGLSAVTPAGEALGTIVAVEDFGAGDLLEIAPADGPTAYVPFTREVVPEVDIAAGRVVVVAPEGTFGESEAEAAEDPS